MDIIGGLIPKRTVHRLFALALFAVLLIVFRKLLILLVFFVAFERLIGVPARFIASRSKVPYKGAVVGMTLALLGVVGGAVAFGIVKAIGSYKVLRVIIPERIASLKSTPAFHELEAHFEDAGGLIEKAQHYAAGAVTYLAALGHVLLFATVGFVLAFVYLLEREEIDGFAKKISPRSLVGRLVRWYGFVVEAIAVTLQFQVVVALFNAVTTYPVLLILHIPNATALMLGIFFSGLVPVVGNFAIGAILTIMAWQAKGWFGVIAFTVLTFLLHKVESYYLSPKLAQKHVRIPSFLLLVSLIVWEQLLGLTGLLVSFPFLFVAAKIREDLKAPPPDPFLESTEEPVSAASP
ncbi:MAG: AI-2E family transporter [Deltaproteobacteria bacterium]|nr:AI-2E family transporter [Deltaproteobacteria bacterium]